MSLGKSAMSLQKIIESGNIKFVRWILEEFKPDTSAVVLHNLCRAGKSKMIELLIAHGVDVDKYHNGETAFHVAVKVRSTNCAEVLYDHVNINLKTRLGETALSLALHGYTSFARRLLNDPRVDINAKDNCGDTILHDICWKNYSSLINIIFGRADININAQNSLGETPLMVACSYNNVSAAEALLTRDDIDLTLTDNKGGTIHEYIALTGSEYFMTLFRAVQAA